MALRPLTLADLRRYAVSRTLFAPITLGRAIGKLGFVQADPIRAPARAQDLTLRHRVRNYRAGDLERRYANLGIEEDFFVNYGFLPRATHAVMHPRTPRKAWTKASETRANAILDFVRANGVVHPRDVDAHFQHGKTQNWFGGSSNASTQLLDGLLNEVLATGPVDWMAQKPSDGHFDAPFEAWQWQLEIRKQELGDPYRVHAVVRDEHGVQFEIETQMAPRLSDAEEPDRRPQTPIDRQSRYDQQKQ